MAPKMNSLIKICKEDFTNMVNTTRASLMAQIAELKYFGIITNQQEQTMIKKVNEWDNLRKIAELNNSPEHKAMLSAMNEIANDLSNE